MIAARADLLRAGRHVHEGAERPSTEKKILRLPGPAWDRLGLSSPGNVISSTAVECHSLEDVILFLPIEEVRWRDGESASLLGKLVCGGTCQTCTKRSASPKRQRFLREQRGRPLKDGGIRPDTKGHDDELQQRRSRNSYATA